MMDKSSRANWKAAKEVLRNWKTSGKHVLKVQEESGGIKSVDISEPETHRKRKIQLGD